MSDQSTPDRLSQEDAKLLIDSIAEVEREEAAKDEAPAEQESTDSVSAES